MDATWGVVIVSVVGVLGTVGATWLQTWHSRLMSREQRADEQRQANREALLTAYKEFMDAADAHDREVAKAVGGGTRSRIVAVGDPSLSNAASALNSAKRAIRRAELNLTVLAPSAVRSAAHAVAALYLDSERGKATTAEAEATKDQLVSAVHNVLDPLGMPEPSVGGAAREPKKTDTLDDQL